MSNEPLVANKDATQLDLSKIILNTAKLKTNTEFFQDNINYDNLNNYINLNSDLFSKFNNENIIYEKPSKEIKITILNDILEIYADEKKIFNLNLKNKETSYINLLFDKNLNFINDEYNKEALVPRKILYRSGIINNVTTVANINPQLIASTIGTRKGSVPPQP